jgi:uncharacterized Tic20 family protein
MDTTISENQKNVAAVMHLSTFSKFFFPFGNFIAPLLLWTFNKEHKFVEEHGREAINFQLSIFIYSLIIGLICLPFVLIFATDFVSLIDAIDHTVGNVSLHDVKNLSGYIVIIFIAAILLFGLFIFELYAVISATIVASKGNAYKYPFSISFIKTIPQPHSLNRE